MTTKGWPKKGDFVKPDRAQVEKGLKKYAKVMRSERPPGEREEFAVPQTARLRKVM
jgi:hypothetical protein